MIPLWVELKLNRNTVATQIYTENWKRTILTPYPIERLAPTVRNMNQVAKETNMKVMNSTNCIYKYSRRTDST